MIDWFAWLVVLAAGLYLVGLSAILWVSPARAEYFLSGFAGSSLAHYMELVLRLIAGAAILLSASRMLFSGFFMIFGGLLVFTTAGLAAVPWRLHQRFARWAVPYATENAKLFALASFLLGGIVLASLILGSGPSDGVARF